MGADPGPAGDESRLRRWLSRTTVAAASLHTLSDVLEWVGGGFSSAQLRLSYLAFLPMPALLLGLYLVQRPRIPRYGLAGALLYGFAFVYFAHTALAALANGVESYGAMWRELGATYTFHGAMMILGGFLFGLASLRAGVVPRRTAALFVAGIALHLAVAGLALPEIVQTLASTVRNLGLATLGWAAREEGAARRSEEEAAP